MDLQKYFSHNLSYNNSLKDYKVWNTFTVNYLISFPISNEKVKHGR